MKLVIQRVKEASVKVEGEIISSIQAGLLLFVCFEQGDTDAALTKAVEKVSKLRIFEDENGKMNQDLHAIGGEVLSVSQFTLSWDGSGGHRPSFEQSMNPNEARLKYALFNRELRAKGLTVKEGQFGAHMIVSIVNDGPVTFVLNF
jgi:D-tyrosyl-tRNA(Tyr) deacylase